MLRELTDRVTLRAFTCVVLVLTSVGLTVTGQLDPQFVAGGFMAVMMNLWPRESK